MSTDSPLKQAKPASKKRPLTALMCSNESLGYMNPAGVVSSLGSCVAIVDRNYAISCHW